MASSQRFFEPRCEQVHRYEGTVNQFLGDGFMALFGAPVAHEDDARARGAGRRSEFAMRSAIRTPCLGCPPGAALSVRMGLHTGPVVVGLRRRQPAHGLHRHRRYYESRGTPRAERSAWRDPGERGDCAGWSKVTPTSSLCPRLQSKARPSPSTHSGSRRPRANAARVSRQERALSPLVGAGSGDGLAARGVRGRCWPGRGRWWGIVGEPGVGKSRGALRVRGACSSSMTCTYLEGWCQSSGSRSPICRCWMYCAAVCGYRGFGYAGAGGAEGAGDGMQAWGCRCTTMRPICCACSGSIRAVEVADRRLTPEAIQAHTLEVLSRVLLAHGRDLLSCWGSRTCTGSTRLGSVLRSPGREPGRRADPAAHHQSPRLLAAMDQQELHHADCAARPVDRSEPAHHPGHGCALQGGEHNGRGHPEQGGGKPAIPGRACPCARSAGGAGRCTAPA